MYIEPIQGIQCYPELRNTTLSLKPLSTTIASLQETHVPCISLKGFSILGFNHLVEFILIGCSVLMITNLIDKPK